MNDSHSPAVYKEERTVQKLIYQVSTTMNMSSSSSSSPHSCQGTGSMTNSSNFSCFPSAPTCESPVNLDIAGCGCKGNANNAACNCDGCDCTPMPEYSKAGKIARQLLTKVTRWRKYKSPRTLTKSTKKNLTDSFHVDGNR
ncbi:hypothetical protein BT96DRAFT_332897 [Gymnopus androsaceus JB14]|uniref:Uncharacterized protein n=1 Tax=Gymnopus androsaceus JB14 TaxID=1447944 RepID=A0A6A4GZ59_9AGAR|nr:hypothetical protein BT96DRAFT_332897 [Gymnopus androsaceus JB14]